jgi:flagellar biosynthesis GTPase FlhF
MEEMPNSATTPKSSVTDEPYKGPSATVAALGLGAIESKVMWLVGLITGGAVGAVASKKVNALAERSKLLAENIKAHPNEHSKFVNGLKRAAGTSISKIFEWSEKLVTHLPGHEKMLRKLGSINRGKAIVASAGVTSLLAVIGSLIHGAFSGAKSAHEGQDQFARAKGEIKALHAENNALTSELQQASQARAKDKNKYTENEALTAELEKTAKELAREKAQQTKKTAMAKISENAANSDAPGHLVSQIESRDHAQSQQNELGEHHPENAR